MLEPVLLIHPAALYIPYKASIKQHLAWLYFVHNASEDIESKKSFVVSLQALKEGINYKSEKNNQVLIQLIKKLTKVRVQFDMFNPEGDWPYQALLQRCQVPKYTGGCRYSFHPDVQDVLKQSDIKKPLRIEILKKFRSKHTLAIYCLLVSRLSESITYTELKMSLEDMTRFLGYNEEDMLLPGDLKRKLVQQVKKELNQCSDLSVSIEPIQEKRRKIKGFNLIAQLKPNQQKVYQAIYQGQFSQLSKALQPNPHLKREIVAETQKKSEKKESKNRSIDARHVVELKEIKKKQPLAFTIESFQQPQSPRPTRSKIIDLEMIEHPQVKEEALKRFQKRLESYYKNQMQDNMQNHLETHFSTYQEKFIQILEQSVNDFMLRNIVNRNMGRKNPQLMKLSQTIADGIMDNTELFDFHPPTFEDWKSQFEIDSANQDVLNQLKEDALKAAQQIYRY